MILVSGFARGGTNILWNILQSHPQVCSPRLETGEIFYESHVLRILKKSPWIPGISRFMVDHILYNYKMLTLGHPTNIYKTEDERFTEEEVSRSTLCMKSVNDDIFLTDLLIKTYPELYMIGLVRSGYALLDGNIRRGKSVRETAVLYNRITNEMRTYEKRLSRYKMIKFEEVLRNPFDMGAKLFEFAEMEPTRIEKIRLKSKKLIKSNSEHGVAFGRLNKKYWVSRSEIRDILDLDINKRQAQRLKPEMILEFNAVAGESMKYLGYTLWKTKDEIMEHLVTGM